MSENKDGATRAITKGLLGGLEFGLIMYLAVLFLRVAINAISGATIVPALTEVGGFAIGFSGGVVKNL